MDPLSEHELLEVWDLGQALHPVDRALALLSIACPEATRDDLVGLSVGQRNQLLVELRTETFGRTLDVTARCPDCNEQVEVGVDGRRLGGLAGDGDADPLELEADGYRIVFRLLDSHDLALAAGCDSVEQARSLLIERSVVEKRCAGGVCSTGELPETVVRALADEIAARDPLSEVRLELVCPQCGGSWTRELDVAELLWHEVDLGAKRLLREVDSLARAYGWTEAQILALSPTRRRCYLEMVTV
jgi:Zn finger protein HypA/HybF involved in hydrogenase expression